VAVNFRDFRIGWRLLVKEPAYSAAAIAGLAVGFAVCILLLGYVRYCYTYNAHLSDSARIFVVKERHNLLPRPEWRVRAPAALRDVALASAPGATATRAKVVDVAARNGAIAAPLTLRVVDANYVAFFGKRTLAGDAAAALARPDALVLSRAKALQLFGRPDALGMVLHIDGLPFEVKAILEDEPGNSTVGFDALVGAGKHSWDEAPAPGPIDAEWRELKQLYVKLPLNADPAALADALQAAVALQVDARAPAAWRARLGGARMTEIAVARLDALYFDQELLRSRSGAAFGNRQLVLALGALALLILALAATNYVNLAAVRTLSRQREIGVRKALGAGPARLAGQFVAESLLVCLLATLAGLALAWLAVPLFGELVNRPMAGMLDLQTCAGALALGVLTGVLAALYPAWIALRLPAAHSFNERGGGESRGALRLRRVVTVFQIGTAICLVGVTLAVGWQADYASRADPGFDPAPLLVLTLPDDPEPVAARAFQAELARLAQVAGVALISEAVGRDGNKLVQMLKVGGVERRIEVKPVSPNFFQLLGIGALNGRLFDARVDQPDGATVVLNAAGARAFGFERPQDAIGTLIEDGKRIVGIAPDLRYRTLRETAEPMMYVLSALQPVLLVKVKGEREAAAAALAGSWQRHYPDAVFEAVAAGSVFAANYVEDRRLCKILTAASLVATILAGFGIYVLSAYSVKRRAREIVLRKIHGATGGDIGRLVAREFMLLLAIGAAIGMPLAMLAIERHLAPFVERAPMGGWPAGAALASVAVVAAAAIARHTVRAMRLLPAAALRN
jgi:putative ABC transport system permease protein